MSSSAPEFSSPEIHTPRGVHEQLAYFADPVNYQTGWDESGVVFCAYGLSLLDVSLVTNSISQDQWSTARQTYADTFLAGKDASQFRAWYMQKIGETALDPSSPEHGDLPVYIDWFCHENNIDIDTTGIETIIQSHKKDETPAQPQSQSNEQSAQTITRLGQEMVQMHAQMESVKAELEGSRGNLKAMQKQLNVKTTELAATNRRLEEMNPENIRLRKAAREAEESRAAMESALAEFRIEGNRRADVDNFLADSRQEVKGKLKPGEKFLADFGLTRRLLLMAEPRNIPILRKMITAQLRAKSLHSDQGSDGVIFAEVMAIITAVENINKK